MQKRKAVEGIKIGNENRYRCYEFETEISSRMCGLIYARSEEEAREAVLLGKKDEIIETFDVKVENIVQLSEVKEDFSK